MASLAPFASSPTHAHAGVHTSAALASPSVSPPSSGSRPTLALSAESKFDLSQPQSHTPSPADEHPSTKRRCQRLYVGVGIAIAAIVVLALAIALPVALTARHRSRHPTSNAGSSSGGADAKGGDPGANPESPTGAVTGGDGSTVLMSNGSSFTYTNPFGGFWVADPRNPFNNTARAQQFTKSLAEPWDFAADQIRGVNLGGWLVLEPFLSPALFEKYQNVTPSPALPGGQAVDEWTLSVAMRNDTGPGGGIAQIEEHYRTFVTEQDFAAIAGAGLNWVRLPVPFWAIDTWPPEPFLARTAWTYVLLALQWARKYGLRVFLELHTVPGSQNGYNHSGRLGTINFLNGYMGLANAQRTLDYVRALVEFVAQDAYADVVPVFGLVNEPLLGIIGRDQLTRFYLQAHDMVRNITGIGKGPYIAIHDGFQADASWKDFLPGADRIILDTHPYVAFGGDFAHPLSYWPQVGCLAYSNNQSQRDFGVTLSGEFSGAINSCGLWVTGVGPEPAPSSTSTEADCATWDAWERWTPDMKAGIRNFVMAQMDAMARPGYFFWTWKVGRSAASGRVQAPFWSYELGLQNGWIPPDPRSALTLCASLSPSPASPWTGPYQPWQTGGAGAGTIADSARASFAQYPPPALSNVAGADPARLPMYTATAAPVTLPPPTFAYTYTSKGRAQVGTVGAGDGWADARDTRAWAVPVQGCVYPDAWGPAQGATGEVCTGATAAAAVRGKGVGARTTAAPAAVETV